MSNKFAEGKKALGICDRCGLTFKLNRLLNETQNKELTNLRVCKSCIDPDHPQNFISDLKGFDDPKPLKDWRQDPYTAPNNTGNFTSWEFDVDAGDWLVANASAIVSLGSISIIPDETIESYMLREVAEGNELALEASDYNYLRMGIDRPSDLGVDWAIRVQWKRTTDSTWDDTTGRVVTVADPEFKGSEDSREVTIPLSDLTDWDGTIEEIRIRFHSDINKNVSVDYIRFNEF
jgi:hypothetical protein